MSKTKGALLILVLSFVTFGGLFWQPIQPVHDWSKVTFRPKSVAIPLSKLTVKVPAFREVRLWGNAVELYELFRHKASVCIDYQGKVLCQDLKQPSPH